jgi:DNA end-binding protein Ku
LRISTSSLTAPFIAAKINLSHIQVKNQYKILPNSEISIKFSLVFLLLQQHQPFPRMDVVFPNQPISKGKEDPAMHTMWKGSISFGLVNIPVKMFAATEDKTLKFRYLHQKCKTPIQYVRRCPTCDMEVEWGDIVKGYEYESGHFIILEDEELEALQEKTTKAIEIIDFVNLEEIDPIFFDKSYYLAPQEPNNKAYSLLREAMDATGKIAVAKVTMRSKQNLAVIRIFKKCILMETIFYPDEVRDVALVPGIGEGVTVSEKELEMAKQLINNLAAPFDPDKYKDEYRESLQELIHKKIEGEEFHVTAEAPKANIIDLMDALKASIEATQPKVTKRKTSGRKKTVS